MTSKFKKLKEQLRTLEEGEMLSEKRVVNKGNSSKLLQSGISSPSWFKYLLFASFLGAFLVYASATYLGPSSLSQNPVEQFTTWIGQPDEELLEGMGAWMEEMGYTGLTREDLIELREEGITATYTSRMRDLGYEDLSLEELVRLRQSGVSSTFAAMMKELGYTLTVDDLIRLEQHDVTAYYTSNLHDLGYTDLTMDELIRLKDTGVTTSEVEKLVEERETPPGVDEIIRYHISNQ